jgi:Predicted metal-dependent hydrolase of the TIM-barrel fold
MKQLFEVKQVDIDYYNNYVKDFLPERFLDIHTHVWLDEFKIPNIVVPERTVKWPSMIALDNSIEDLMESFRLMFPDKKPGALIFGQVSEEIDTRKGNEYISKCAKEYRLPSLFVASPDMSAEEFEEGIEKGGFLGCKVYLNYSPHYIPENEIRIFDFLPHHQLKVLDKRGWVVMLHIPRPGRLKDPVNLAQMLEIEEKYPNVKLIIAHVGRAYCKEDIGNAFDILSKTKNMNFDITANTNSYVFEKLLEAVGPGRVLFGSDLPILRMRSRRICENGKYINLVPKGLYGDVSTDSHMREVVGKEAEELTFFMYEEINAFRVAAEKTGLSKEQVKDVFYNNAAKLLALSQL